MNTLYILAAIVAGGVVAWIISVLSLKSRTVPKVQMEELNKLTQESKTALLIEQEKNKNLTAQLETAREQAMALNTSIGDLTKTTAEYTARLNSAQENLKEKNLDLEKAKEELRQKTEEFNNANKSLAEFRANNLALNEKLETQKKEIEELAKKFNTEFENIANKILEEKTQKFTTQNQSNLEQILKPLGENIDQFRKKVEEVYDKESKERFSLGREVKNLMELNQQISKEATNLTNALKGSSKTQGDWGQMILENILEKSGLVKDREYFVQEFLKDRDGNYLKNEQGNKMQPDVIVAYPDDRKIIIDSKVSLTAYTRYVAADDPAEQQKALKEHLASLKKHIDELSVKSYQDYAASLDFVMMFVPNEPAFMVAMQQDAEIWNYAYQKRILLISPTNLIAALKLIVDLWKREYQNQNAQAIAERGKLLYEKFVGFVDDLSSLGGLLDKARSSYSEAFDKLKSGRGNLISQADKLMSLGVKAKKNLPNSLVSEALMEEGEEERSEVKTNQT
ncbi:MAG: DNA recombination protein RmuC [Bacteroidales bacterium]|nr:DNA recombination protein RmuC [Bacteroidales bacterium]MDD3431252.1 DNA recombination protein RmuC [Bacteroidales bacterium]MDD4362157.1 DNA recombination protein RmuC [Bacteroidales bacterium]MDD4430384.1 DNA recombination protein RmuC [Bacteroidales bacterium]